MGYVFGIFYNETNNLGWNFGLKETDVESNFKQFCLIIDAYRSKELLESLPEKNLKLYDRSKQTKYFEQLIEE